MNLTTTIALLGLVTVASLEAQDSPYGAIDSFYQVNPDLNVGQYAGRVVNPAYWLVNWNRWSEMDERLTTNGYVRLGISNWESDNAVWGGEPRRDMALSYAKAIGAEVIMYSIRGATDRYNNTEHYVGFYAQSKGRRMDNTQHSTTRPNDAQASIAMNRLQDALGKPHVKGGVHYDPRTDTYNWIGPKFGRHMSESASQFLSEVGPYL